MLVVLIMLVGYAGAESTDSTRDKLYEDGYYFPDYGVNSFESLKADSNVIETRGMVPEINENKEKIEWLNSIKECINISEPELHPYMKEYGGPLTGFGTNYGGYLFVEFDPELDGKVDTSTIDKFYEIINSDAKQNKISEVPVVFRIGGTEIEESRSSYWRPLIGGIKIKDLWTVDSTLSFAAVDGQGNKGYVMSGHAAMDAGGVGATIIQYNGGIGYVTDIVGLFSDSAWVQYSNVNPKIYYDDTNIVRDVYNYGDPSLGFTVYKSGKQSGLTSGIVTEEYENQNSQTFGTLLDQFRATYSSAGGDSGAPVFTKYGTKVVIRGVHRGSYGSDATFSPISGVILDLDVVPIKA
jgi:hypothetical protein